jgi:hypothetical protein
VCLCVEQRIASQLSMLMHRHTPPTLQGGANAEPLHHTHVLVCVRAWGRGRPTGRGSMSSWSSSWGTPPPPRCISPSRTRPASATTARCVWVCGCVRHTACVSDLLGIYVMEVYPHPNLTHGCGQVGVWEKGLSELIEGEEGDWRGEAVLMRPSEGADQEVV